MFIKLTGMKDNWTGYMNINHIVNISPAKSNGVARAGSCIIDINNEECYFKETPEEIIELIRNCPTS